MLTLGLKNMQALIQKGPFADIRSALDVLERVACSIKFNEPVLLVGETGTGKTTLVQNLASWLKRPLTVVVRTNSNKLPCVESITCLPLQIH